MIQTAPTTIAAIESRAVAGLCVHELIVRQASLTPDAVAVRCGDVTLSYRELVRRAGGVANLLRARGLASETSVAICGEPSAETVVAALATLLAGGAYVLVPVHEPSERVSNILSAARARFIVGSASLRARMASASEACWIETPAAGAIAGEGLASARCTPDNLAFIRCTSGSTGRPKAVMNTHRSLTSRLQSGILPDIQAHDVCAVNLQQGFGARLFYPLALGATVVVIPHEHFLDAAQLARCIWDSGITSLYVVPTLLRALLARGDEVVARLRRLRAITVGGEALTEDLVQQWLARLPGVALISLYGSSESGTAASILELSCEHPTLWRSIGRPAPNTAVHVVDGDLRRVPAGTVGEICVTSLHLARGYVGAAGLTAERFVPNPFAHPPGSRLYRTGDLGRLLRDGSIEFVGRADHQVKIRGYRVELGEIEAALRRHPRVRDVAVTAEAIADASDRGGPTRRLVAYLVTSGDTPLSIAELRAFAAERLPMHELPSAFVLIERLPLLATGKVDRRALPPVSLRRPKLDTPFMPARDTIEEAVAEIWRDALVLDSVGAGDGFLELGGDSLSAQRVVWAIEQRFGVTLPVTAILTPATVAVVASVLRGSGATPRVM